MKDGEQRDLFDAEAIDSGIVGKNARETREGLKRSFDGVARDAAGWLWPFRQYQFRGGRFPVALHGDVCCEQTCGRRLH